MASIFRFCLLFLFTAATSASTYYVDTTNSAASDGNPGSLASPWKTLGKAISVAAAGDKVIAQPGEYNEFITNTASGSAGSPITFTGVRDANGQWLTIIDPSTTITGWAAAAEIGAGVYKKTNSFVVRQLTIGQKHVGFVSTLGNMATDIQAAYATNWTTGAQLLALPVGVQVKFNGWFPSDPTIYFWDGIEALWGSGGAGNTTCYLRLRDGSDPSAVSVRVAPNNSGSVTATLTYPAIKMSGISYVVWSNFVVRGAYGGFLITDSSHDNIITSNYIAHGYSRIQLKDGAYRNTIARNSMTLDYYGLTDPGAWEYGTTTTQYTNCVFYLLSKELMGASSVWDQGVQLYECGNSNVIIGNHIYSHIGNGVSLWGTTANVYTNTTVASNIIEKCASIGIQLLEGNTTNRIHDNLLADSNLNIRYHRLESAQPDRCYYVYRNRMYLPTGVGEHFFFYYSSASPSAYHPLAWNYNNSMSGGHGALTDNGNGYPDRAGGHTNMYWFNNLISVTDPFVSFSDLFFSTAGMFAAFDYNLLKPKTPDPAWYGAHNIEQSALEWANSPTMTFLLVPGSAAIDGGTNLSGLFPDTATKYGPAWDIGAYEYSPPAPPQISTITLRVGTMRSP